MKEPTKILWALGLVLFTAAMIAYPRTVFEGAVTGLNTWWNIVFPSLLPFFIASELLLNFGIVHFMGILLEPVMRPLFNVPGSGSFVMAVGYTSGYPIGAMVTARLRSQGLCTRTEAERLMAFTNNSSPLFMLVAVAVGMFNNPDLGILIAGAHYLSNLTLGLLMSFNSRKNDKPALPSPQMSGNLVRLAFREMFLILRQERRPAGKIMSEAIKNAIASLLNIGGFIILFAVMIRLLTALGGIKCLAGFLGIFLLPLGFDPAILPALSSGFFEMTIGSKQASEAAVPLIQQVTAVGMILAWSGLSVHAQAANMIADTDIRMFPYVIARIIHTILAGLYTFLFCKFAFPLAEPAQPALAPSISLLAASYTLTSLQLCLHFLIALGAIILLAITMHSFNSLRLYFWRVPR
jgi:sporulation integral membrane protein YlbJ